MRQPAREDGWGLTAAVTGPATGPVALPAPDDRGVVGPAASVKGLEEMAREVGLRRVRFLAWRDLDDSEAGGSELHAHRIATLWAQAGIEVTVRTSSVSGQPASISRDGYRVQRRSGRYAVFPSAAWEGLREGWRPGDGLVEVWNGMPFFTPLWYRGPRITFLHHVHAEMWQMALPAWMARIGETVESRIAPRLYRKARLVTLSESSRQEILTLPGLTPEQVSVAPPGIEDRFRPGGERSKEPLVVAVGRLVPVKRFDLLIDALLRVKEKCPDLRVAILGEGYERDRLESLCRRHLADRWILMPGRVGDDELVEWYRRAWVVASTSRREGWGMTLTEAGACGTPSVATDIAGHRDAVLDGRTGLLADGADGVASALVEVLTDERLRGRLGRGAQEHARWYSWHATARSTLEAMVSEVKG